MILERLKEFAKRVELPREGYAKIPIRYIINLDNGGKFLPPMVRVGDESKQGKKSAPLAYDLPFVEKTSGIKANLLSGNIEYVIGLPRPKELEKKRKEGKEEKYLADVGSRHAAFVEEVDRCLKETSNQDVRAVSMFLHEMIQEARTSLPSDFGDPDNFTFRVDGRLASDHDVVAAYWARAVATEADDEVDDNGTTSDEDEVEVVPKSCMVCGRDSVPLQTHLKIKPVPGGNTSGVAVMSGNKNAFYSFGLKRAYLSPVCRECSEPIHKSLLWMIRSETNSFVIPKKAVFLFWTREMSLFSIPALFGEPTEDSVKALMASPRTGRAYAAEDVEANAFYMLALSGSGGRAVVRDWIETSLNLVQENLSRYFQAQHVSGGREPYQKLLALAGATVRDLDELAPWVSISLVEHALKGTPLPPALLSVAVRRCAVGKTNPGTRKREHVNAQQAALVKLCLSSWHKHDNHNLSEDWMIKLDPNNEEPAYLYGRLFNVLEQIQEAATGGDSVERTFGTAIMSPVSTLPRQIARSTVHLRKLMRDKPGYAINYNKLLSEIQGKLGVDPAFKKQLDAHEQGLFVLGYWHQHAARFEKRGESENNEQ